MNTWLTADCHFDHGNIIKYCNRPFKDIDEMNEKIIHNWNMRVNCGDTVYHLGDFCFRGEKANFWEELLYGKIIHIEGNHDHNNGVKTILKTAVFEFGNKLILVQYMPPTMKLEVPEFFDFVLCGHVHDKWKFQWLENDKNSIPIINVGVDVWGFMPVSLQEILKFYESIIK